MQPENIEVMLPSMLDFSEEDLDNLLFPIEIIW